MADKAFDPQTAGLEDNYAPQLGPVTADEPATEDEQRAMDAALLDMKDYLYSEEGMANVVNMLNGEGELFEKVPSVAFPLLQKIHAEHPEAEASAFFGENGLIQQSVELIWEVAEQEEMPGYDDNDQAAGAMINLYKKIGEFVNEKQDKASIEEARALGSEMLRTQDSGKVQSEEEFQANAAQAAKKPQPKGLLS